MIRDFLDSLQPDRNSLLSQLSKHITDDMLAKIALADYGQGQGQHVAALRLLRDKGIFVEPMEWYPCEVLELVRNSEPDGSPDSDRVRDHWVRAFACAALLRAREEPWKYEGAAAPSFTLIQLLDSLEALPADLTRNAVRLVASMMLHSDLDQGDAQPIYYGVALLWLALHLGASSSDQELIELAEWVVRREAEIHRNCRWAFERWLLGIAHDPPPSKWEPLGMRLSSLDLGGHAQQLKDWVKLIGEELGGHALNAT